MSPFHDLSQRGGISLPVERRLRSSNPLKANTELRVVSLPRYVRLLSLGVIGLAGMLSLGVGGVALVQGYVSRPSTVGMRDLKGANRHAETPSSRAKVRGESGASMSATAADSPVEVAANGVRQRPWAAQSRPAPRRPESISENQPRTLETPYVEVATAP